MGPNLTIRTAGRSFGCEVAKSYICPAFGILNDTKVLDKDLSLGARRSRYPPREGCCLGGFLFRFRASVLVGLWLDFWGPGHSTTSPWIPKTIGENDATAVFDFRP